MDGQRAPQPRNDSPLRSAPLSPPSQTICSSFLLVCDADAGTTLLVIYVRRVLGYIEADFCSQVPLILHHLSRSTRYAHF